MPSFGDIMEAVDLLQVKAVNLDSTRCVRATNRNSKCGKCEQACIADAIQVSRGEIDIDPAACVNCGCCVPVCPTSALSMTEPSMKTVFKRAITVSDPSSRSCAFACSRIASKHVGDPDKFAEVPCLGHISELEIIELAAVGIDDILLIDGNCETCKLGKASSRIDETVETASKLLDAAESEAIITRQSEFPEEYQSSGTNVRGEGRRGLLRQTTSYVKTVAGNVAKKTIEEKLNEAGMGKDADTEHFKHGKGVTHFEPADNYRLIECLEKLQPQLSNGNESALQDFSDEPSDKMSTRHFGNVNVDVERCSGCGMCVLFCPTQALKYEEFEQPDNDEARYCDFQAADCTQCMLCKDVCLRECLEVSPEVSLEEILDFEPRLVEIAKPKKTTSLAGLAKRNH